MEPEFDFKLLLHFIKFTKKVSPIKLSYSLMLLVLNLIICFDAFTNIHVLERTKLPLQMAMKYFILEPNVSDQNLETVGPAGMPGEALCHASSNEAEISEDQEAELAIYTPSK